MAVGLMHPEQQHAGWDIARNGMGWVGWMLCAYLRAVVEVRTYQPANTRTRL